MKVIRAEDLTRLMDDALGARLRLTPAVALTGRRVEWFAPTC